MKQRTAGKVVRGIEIRSEKYVRASSTVRILLVLVVLVSAAAIGCLFLPWQQTSFGTGRVLAYVPDDRVQVVQSPLEGRIDHWHVVEGSVVKKGEPLVDIRDIDPNIMERLRNEKEAARQKLIATEKALEFSRRNLERQRSLAQRGLSSQRSYELAELEVAKLVSDLSSATAEVARVEVRVSRQAAQTVVAPRDGIIQRILATQGSTVIQAGGTVALLVPNTDSRAVEVVIDGNDVPLIQVGRKARIQFEGWPAVQFVGWPMTAVGTFGGKVLVIDPTDDGTGRFRLLIGPDPNDDPWPEPAFLRQGIRAQAWVLLDQVTIGWEVWRIINGFPISIRQPFSSTLSGEDATGTGKGGKREVAAKSDGGK